VVLKRWLGLPEAAYDRDCHATATLAGDFPDFRLEHTQKALQRAGTKRKSFCLENAFPPGRLSSTDLIKRVVKMLQLFKIFLLDPVIHLWMCVEPIMEAKMILETDARASITVSNRPQFGPTRSGE
jgi:hypothetical protein